MDSGPALKQCSYSEWSAHCEPGIVLACLWDSTSPIYRWANWGPGNWSNTPMVMWLVRSISQNSNLDSDSSSGSWWQLCGLKHGPLLPLQLLLIQGFLTSAPLTLWAQWSLLWRTVLYIIEDLVAFLTSTHWSHWTLLTTKMSPP